MTSVPLQLTTAVSLPEPGPGASSLESLANGINTISINATQAPASPGAQRLYCIPNFSREPGGDNKYYVICVGRKVGIFNNWGTVQSLVRGFNHNKHKSFVTWADAFEYWRDHCHCNHYHGFANEAAQAPLAASTSERPDPPTVSSDDSDGPPDLLPLAALGASASGALHKGKIKSEVATEEGPLIFAVRGGKHNAVYADQDAAWNAFNEDRRDGFVPVMKFTQSFQAAVDFIVDKKDF